MVLSIVLAVVVAHVIGWAWYSQRGFGKTWMALNGMTPPVPGAECKGMSKTVAISLVLSIVSAMIIYSLIYKYGLQFGCVMAAWLALSFPVYAAPALWEGKSWKLVGLNAAQGLVSTAAMVGIFYWMM